jgi:hypothetical protein
MMRKQRRGVSQKRYRDRADMRVGVEGVRV